MKRMLGSLFLTVAIFLFTLYSCSNTPNSSSSSSTASSASSAAVFIPVVAYTNNFDNSTGSFFLSKGVALTGNNTIATVGTNTCVEIHALSTNANGATGVEVQWNLLQQTVMTNEDFTIDFDIYVPQASRTNLAGIQWAFFDTILHSYVPVYSVYYVPTIVADTWSHVRGYVSASGGSNVSYSGFSTNENPSGWIFDKVRVQFKMLDTDTNLDISFYVDNLAVSNIAR